MLYINDIYIVCLYLSGCAISVILHDVYDTVYDKTNDDKDNNSNQ